MVGLGAPAGAAVLRRLEQRRRLHKVRTGTLHRHPAPAPFSGTLHMHLHLHPAPNTCSRHPAPAPNGTHCKRFVIFSTSNLCDLRVLVGNLKILLVIYGLFGSTFGVF